MTGRNILAEVSPLSAYCFAHFVEQNIEEVEQVVWVVAKILNYFKNSDLNSSHWRLYALKDLSRSGSQCGLNSGSWKERPELSAPLSSWGCSLSLEQVSAVFTRKGGSKSSSSSDTARSILTKARPEALSDKTVSWLYKDSTASEGGHRLRLYGAVLCDRFLRGGTIETHIPLSDRRLVAVKKQLVSWLLSDNEALPEYYVAEHDSSKDEVYCIHTKTTQVPLSPSCLQSTLSLKL